MCLFSFNAADNQCKNVLGIPFTDKANVINIPYDCPLNPPTTFPYDDTFARTRAYLYTAASNGENETQVQKCLSHVNAQFKQQFTIPCDWFGVS